MTTQRYKTLADFFEQTGTKQAALAKRVGVDSATMSLVTTRKRQATLPLAIKLSKLAGVPIESFVLNPAKLEITA